MNLSKNCHLHGFFLSLVQSSYRQLYCSYENNSLITTVAMKTDSLPAIGQGRAGLESAKKAPSPENCH